MTITAEDIEIILSHKLVIRTREKCNGLYLFYSEEFNNFVTNPADARLFASNDAMTAVYHKCSLDANCVMDVMPLEWAPMKLTDLSNWFCEAE